jgi:predicted nucleic acid-binding protein
LRIVLADAGPLIALGKLSRLPLLAQLYKTLHVPRAVYQEAVIAGSVQDAPDAAGIRLFLEHHKIPLLDVPETLLQSYSPDSVLGMGERHVLTLAQSLKGDEILVLLDDEMARAEARRLGLQVKGTLGILVEAFRTGLLSFEEAELLLLEIAARSDIWISEKLCHQIIEQLRKDR